MRRLLVVAAVVIGTPTLAAAAGAWTTVATDLGDGRLVGIRTDASTELVTWVGRNGDVLVSRDGAPPATAIHADGSFASPEVFVQLPGGTLLLYYATTRGIDRVSSDDDGVSWHDAGRTGFPPGAHIDNATVRRDGTPVFAGTIADSAQTDAPWDFAVFEGVDGVDFWRGPGGGVGTVGRGSGDKAYVMYWSDEELTVPGSVRGTFARRLGTNATPLGPVRTLSKRDFGGSFVRNRKGRAIAVVPHDLSLRFVNLEVRSTSVRRLPAYAGGGIASALTDGRGRLSVLWDDGTGVRSARATLVGAALRAGDAAAYPTAADGSSAGGGLIAFARTDGTVDVFTIVDRTLLRQRFRAR